MKNYINTFNGLRLTSLALIAAALLVSCSDDDDAPDVINEEEVITTMNVELIGGLASVINLQSQDLDGDGPNSPEITISGDPIVANTTYSGTIELLNETVTPSVDITEEVAEEDEEHQFFFTAGGSIMEVTYDDEDADGNPVGLAFILTTGDAGSGTLQITLRHEPTKPNDGTLADAGGETDIVQTFSLTVVE